MNHDLAIALVTLATLVLVLLVLYLAQRIR